MGIILDILKEIPLSAILRERIAELEREIAAKDATIKRYEALCPEKTLQAPKVNALPLEPCPYCNQAAGVLRDRKRDKIFGDLGGFTHYYQCSNCGKEYEKDVDH